MVKDVVYLVESINTVYHNNKRIDLTEEFVCIGEARVYAKKISKKYGIEVFISIVGGERWINGKRV